MPDGYLINLSSRVLGWFDRGTQWICDTGEIVSFSEGNGEQEASQSAKSCHQCPHNL